MNITKFMSDQDPDYQNVLLELQRLLESVPHQVKEALDLTSSKIFKTDGKFHEEAHHQDQSAMNHDQSTVHKDSTLTQPTRSVNTFSGTFNSGGGKMFQGNQFDSKGGPMNF